jgi:hypothetical protein
VTQYSSPGCIPNKHNLLEGRPTQKPPLCTLKEEDKEWLQRVILQKQAQAASPKAKHSFE